MVQLPWPQHLNCSTFPQHSAIWMYKATFIHRVTSVFNNLTNCTINFLFSFKPFYVIIHAATDHNARTTTIPHFTFPSYGHWLFQVYFFCCELCTEIHVSSYVCFYFLLAVVSFYLNLFICYFCWLGFRGNEQAARREDIPLREILGPLPPVPEQWHFYPQFYPQVLLFHFILL